MEDAGEIRLWFWTITDEFTGRRRRTRYRMTEASALEGHGADAVKVEGTLEIRRPVGCTSELLKRS